MLQDWKKLISEVSFVFSGADGLYVDFYTDYNSKLSKDQISTILESQTPGDCFHDLIVDLYQEEEIEYEGRIVSEIEEALGRELSGEENEELMEQIGELVTFQFPFDHYGKQKVCVNLFLDTGDGNYDFSLNAQHVPCWNGSTEPFQKEASILWLAKQQGYSEEALYAVLNQEEKPDSSTFLGSLWQEMAESHSSMLTVAFFVSMSLDHLIELNEAAREKDAKQPVLIVSKKVDAGLYDPWYGAGGVLDLVFDKDIEIPLDKLRTPIMPDGKDGYSVASCYGICETMWKPDMVHFKV